MCAGIRPIQQNLSDMDELAVLWFMHVSLRFCRAILHFIFYYRPLLLFGSYRLAWGILHVSPPPFGAVLAFLDRVQKALACASSCLRISRFLSAFATCWSSIKWEDGLYIVVE
jgi:hypothetical protein